MYEEVVTSLIYWHATQRECNILHVFLKSVGLEIKLPISMGNDVRNSKNKIEKFDQLALHVKKIDLRITPIRGVCSPPELEVSTFQTKK